MFIQSIQKRVYTLDVFMHRMLVSESYQPCENQALELQSLRWWIPWDAIGIQFYQLLLKLLLLSHFSRVRLCATRETAAHQAPPSLGFSRQEHWSGLPFPFAMHESEKWKWSCSVVPNSSWPQGLQPTRPLRPWDFPGKCTGMECHCLLQLLKLRGIN